MLLIAGTIPQKDMPLVSGTVKLEGDHLVADGYSFPRIQGTGAMISAALATTDYLGKEPPFVVVAGDIGKGDGTKHIYRYLSENLPALKPEVITLHYTQPFMNLIANFCSVVEKSDKPPILIADAGAMYAAKAAGLAGKFDIFTPDPSEMAYLADSNATHPAYVSKHLFSSEVEDVPNLIKAAYQNSSAASILLVKGATDYIAKDGNILATVNDPDVPTLEAIGGTGDTITGLVSAFAHAGVDLVQAAILAAKSNRQAGMKVQPTPATRVSEIVDAFPLIFKEKLLDWGLTL